MPRLVLTIGIPCSGKTTWAEAYVKKNPGWININRDDIRGTLVPGSKFVGKREGEVTEIQRALARTAVERGLSIVLSDTNLKADRRAYWRKWADANNYDYEERRFDVDLDEALRRNELRPQGVPARVIRRMYLEHCGQQTKPYSNDPSLPSAVIVDVDGTLAAMHNRSPYAWDKVGQDLPHDDIIDLVRTLENAGYYIIIMTGRDGECREATQDWLEKHGVPYDEYYQRAASDTRKDSVIKEELLRENIEGRYYIKYVIDDRNQVVDTWRMLGLRTLQVAEGDF